MSKFSLKDINHAVFWPPFLLLFGAVMVSLFAKDVFLEAVTSANDWILDHFDIFFSTTSFVMVCLCAVVLFSPLGKLRIGGKDAKPLLTRWRWFSIVLCTTIAVGILFWGTAEPLFHVSSPPDSLGAEAGSPEAERFAMSTMFMHWSFTPYAIYALPALLFALGYYNRKRRYSLGSMLFPLLKKEQGSGLMRGVDAICLFALVAGMAASLGAGLLSISGGLDRFGWEGGGAFRLGIIALFVVVAFTVSAATGLLKGIRILSAWNVAIFIALSLFMFFFGPTEAILGYLGEGLKGYGENFIPHSFSTGIVADEEWSQGWTTFYWANWMAWAPVTALFLGRIAYGRTVREFLLINWILPAVFGILWMSIFGGTALHLETSGTADLVGALKDSGPESIIYEIFNALPWPQLLSVIFLLTMFISYVTAADSNTEAMAGLSSTGVSPESPNPPVYIKFVWGITVGLVAWIMVSAAGIDGIKMLSNLGGLPALLLLMGTTVAMVIWLFRNWRKPRLDQK